MKGLLQEDQRNMKNISYFLTKGSYQNLPIWCYDKNHDSFPFINTYRFQIKNETKYNYEYLRNWISIVHEYNVAILKITQTYLLCKSTISRELGKSSNQVNQENQLNEANPVDYERFLNVNFSKSCRPGMLCILVSYQLTHLNWSHHHYTSQ